MDDFTPLNLFGNDEADNASEIKEETPSAKAEKEEISVGKTIEEHIESEANETVSKTVGAEEITEEKIADTEENIEEETGADKLDKIFESQQQLSEKLKI